MNAQTPSRPFNPQVVVLAQKASQLRKVGKLKDAKEAYQRAIALDSSLPELWFNYGNLLQQIGELQLGEQAFEKAISLNNSFFQAHLNLANALRNREEYARAIVHYENAIALNPKLTLAYQNLGQLLLKRQQFKPASQVFAAWCRLVPNDPTPLNGLGYALQSCGDYERAVAIFQKAVSLNPNRFDSLNNLGILLRMLKRPHDALPHLRKAIELEPTSETALSNLVYTQLGLGYLSEALATTQRIIEKHPRSSVGYMMRGFALMQQARIAAAMDCFDKAQAFDPNNNKAVANALFSMLYRDDLSADEFVKQRQKWIARLPQPPQHYRQWKGEKDPDRRLKVGYVSGDLRSHPVAFFLEPILTNHNAEKVEVFCYDVTAVEDKTTETLKRHAHHWRKCVGMNNTALAQQIYNDGIDILVDLSGHTADNRVGALMHKPAPLQMLYIGYPGSTGLSEMDYVISDRFVSPTETEALYTEKILPLENSFWCFKPRDFAPAPNELPALKNGYVTLGSFNHAAKLSPSTIGLWASVLREIPNAQLKLKSLSFADDETSTYFRKQFSELGIDSDRIIFEKPTLKFEDFFFAYHTIDIAIDTIPYNGGTTTCEALWMGVPVVTLRGERFCSRMSHSLLRSVGLGELSVATEEAFVEKVRSLCNNLEQLERIRKELRDKMAASPLCDGKLASSDLETAYRKVWRSFCEA